MGQIATSAIKEASGLAVSRANPGVLWTHNDGSQGKLYAVKDSGELLGTFTLSKSVDDVEEIAIGPGPNGSDHLYVGDIGSNSAAREQVKILRLPEPSLANATPADPITRKVQNEESFTLTYPDGTYDAEGFFVDPVRSELYIITKMPSSTRIYRIGLGQLDPKTPATLEFVTEIGFAKVSGAAISRIGDWIALRREDFAAIWPRHPETSVSDAFSSEAIQIPIVGPPEEPNGEAISFAPDGSGYFTISEGENATIYFFKAADASANLTFAGQPEFTGEGWILQATGCPGLVAVERSSDLVNWNVIGTFRIESTNGTFRDSETTGVQYYRLKRV